MRERRQIPNEEEFKIIYVDAPPQGFRATYSDFFKE